MGPFFTPSPPAPAAGADVYARADAWLSKGLDTDRCTRKSDIIQDSRNDRDRRRSYEVDRSV